MKSLDVSCYDFEDVLEEQKNGAWNPYYINYGGLKATLLKLQPRIIASGSTESERGKSISIQDASDYFGKRLDDEVEKVVLFFLNQQGTLAGELLALNMEAEKARDFAPNKAASSPILSGVHTGAVYDPKHFARLETLQETDSEDSDGHITTLKPPQLARCRTRSRSRSNSVTKAQDGFFKSMMRLSQKIQTGSRKELILSEQEINRFHAAYTEVALALLDLVGFLDINIQALRKIINKFEKTLQVSLGRDYLITRQSKPLSQLKVLYSNEGLLAMMGSLRRALEELSLARDRQAWELGYKRMRQRTFSEVEPVYQKLVKRQKVVEMEQSRTFARLLVGRTDMSLVLALHKEYKQQLAEEALDDEIVEHFPSYYIVLACAFLYNTNTTINGPSCPEYAIQLGGTVTMNGFINGMTPFAATISCIGYSYWTNSCFRAPLMVSVLFILFGNVIYALASHYNAFWMLCVGRLFIGMGIPHGINRRYIADTVPTMRRTSASAIFVAFCAVGTALGPGIAALWGKRSFVLFGHVINAETAPGWIMVVIWSIYLVFLFFGFQEPKYRHNRAPVPKHPQVNQDLETGELFEKMAINQATNQKFEEDMNASSRTLVVNSSLHGEQQALLQRPRKVRCFPKIPVPVQSLLYFYFAQKFITELVAQTVPIIAVHGFGWSVQGVGLIMALIVLPVIPVNLFCGNLSQYFEDRSMLLFKGWSIVIAVIITLDFGCIGIPYTEVQYLFGIFLTFILLQAYEGVLMSLLSRIISPELAQGTLNSGLLATVFGTFGRVVGDFLISLVGFRGSLEKFVDSTFGPSLGLMIVAVSVTMYLFKYYI